MKTRVKDNDDMINYAIIVSVNTLYNRHFILILSLCYIIQSSYICDKLKTLKLVKRKNLI